MVVNFNLQVVVYHPTVQDVTFPEWLNMFGCHCHNATWPLKVKCLFPAVHFMTLMTMEYSVSLCFRKVVITNKCTYTWKQNCHFHSQFENCVNFSHKYFNYGRGGGGDTTQLRIQTSYYDCPILCHKCLNCNHNQISLPMSV